MSGSLPPVGTGTAEKNLDPIVQADAKAAAAAAAAGAGAAAAAPVANVGLPFDHLALGEMNVRYIAFLRAMSAGKANEAEMKLWDAYQLGGGNERRLFEAIIGLPLDKLCCHNLTQILLPISGSYPNHDAVFLAQEGFGRSLVTKALIIKGLRRNFIDERGLPTQSVSCTLHISLPDYKVLMLDGSFHTEFNIGKTYGARRHLDLGFVLGLSQEMGFRHAARMRNQMIATNKFIADQRADGVPELGINVSHVTLAFPPSRLDACENSFVPIVNSNPFSEAGLPSGWVFDKDPHTTK